MNPTYSPYSEHEDEIILMIMENRGKLAQRQALDANLHLLPGRTREGALYRYFTLKNRAELAETRKQQKKEKPKDNLPGFRPGMVMEPWTDEEDALLWNSVQTRPPGKGIHAELKDAHKLLPERSFSSVLNHYYVLKKRFEAEDAETIAPAPEKPPETPPKPPENPPVQSPFFTNRFTTNGTTNTTGTYNTVTYAPRPTWQPPAEQIVIPAEPAPAPPETPSPPMRLADRAEEFIESLYSVVKENKELRKQVEQLQQERANSLGKIEADLEAERNVTARLRKQISTLEEDRDAFLRLMDKARVIGREESGIK